MTDAASAFATEEHQDRQNDRRRRQRAANAERALKMRAARLEAESALDFGTEPRTLPALNTGCSGWYYREWRGAFYPEELPSKDWFPHYASQFSTVELNAPFYSWPTVNAVKTWLRQADGGDFIYTVKVCELITHVKRFTGTETLVRDFGFIADLLGDRMGCFLFQLPPGYRFTPARLAAILSQLDPRRRNVVEFRHASWWNDKVYDAFREAGAIFCSCSAPGLPDELVTTADDVYLRFHGKTQWYRHDYTDEELEIWRDRILQSGCRRVWAYFNNTIGGHAVPNARTFRTMLEGALKV
ncbi:MAG: DUF72 domain-containing protein [Verrucomicrobiota bacterium]